LKTTKTGSCTFNRNELESILRQRGLSDSEINTILRQLPADWSCRRKPYGNDKKCIFHAETKDPEEFEIAFNRELEDMKKQGKFDFTGFIFPEITISSEKSPKTFDRPAFFIGTTFQGQTGFIRVTFNQKAVFDGATFQRARFDRATFREARFIRVIFEGVLFNGAQFYRRAVFNGATFQRAWFSRAEFYERAVFNGVTFQEIAVFGKTTFQRALFNGARFYGKAVFDRTKFIKDAHFNGTILGDADFIGVIFRAVTFDDVALRGVASFLNCAFIGPARFTKIMPTRRGVLKFIGDPSKRVPDLQQFWNRLDKKSKDELEKYWGKEGKGLEQLIKIMNGGKISLRMVSFLHTDMQKVQFLNVQWDREGRSLGPLRIERIVIYDEKLLENMKGPRNYESVAQIYRDLRRTYERSVRYAEAGDFYISEMEMRRLQIAPPPPKQRHKPQKDEGSGRVGIFRTVGEGVRWSIFSWRWWRRNLLSPLAVYRYLSLYGESYALAGLWIFITILLFTFLRTLLSSQGGQSTDLLDNLARSIFALFQLRGEETIDNIERIIGAILTGNLFIALRRRLERR
jgi:uncharacterized protein YjbI with pentapeptide repeats